MNGPGFVAAAVLLAGVWVGAPPPAHAMPSAQHIRAIDAAPAVMDQASRESSASNPPGRLEPFVRTAPLRTSNPNLQREVFGFVDAGNLGSSTVGYTSWPLSLLSTVAYFGIHVNSGDGNLVTYDTGWSVYHSSTMSSFVNAAHANGVRVLMTLILHSTNQVCAGLDPTSASHTVSQAVAEMNWAGIDGVNVNYEADLTTCPNGQTDRDELVAFVKNLRAAMPAGYIAVDTYAGSAEDNLEFFNITGLEPYVNSFFVMSYDSDFANYFEAPLYCSSYCMNPVSPLNTYRFNVTQSIAQYKALVPASKVIIGQPWYGRTGCVTVLNVAHSRVLSNLMTPTYQNAAAVPTSSGVWLYARHRDPGDQTSEWDTWHDFDFNCNLEQYWDDSDSLFGKYRAILQSNVGGVGIFTLDYGGGAPELWSTIATYFSCPATVNVAAAQTTTEFVVPMSAGRCSVARFDLQQRDPSLNQGWFNAGPVAVSGSTGTFTAEGFVGHTYQFRARALSTAGVLSEWSGPIATQVASTATPSHPFSGMYTLDAYGGVNSADSPPLDIGAYWPGWGIARAAHPQPGTMSPESGFVLDGWGGLHPFGASGLAETSGASGHYWSGWDIARDFAFLPNGTGGLVLDGFGGLHPFRVNGSTAPLTVQTTAYWPYWDIARKVVIFADGTGGYVLDGWGGLHPFGINGPPPVSDAKLKMTGYWQGWNIARDVVLVPGNGGGHSGYVLDGWGGLHPFYVTSDAGAVMPAGINTSGYWPWWDIARGVWLVPGSATSGYTLDGWGGLHPFGGAPAVKSSSYWPGQDIAKGVWGA